MNTFVLWMKSGEERGRLVLWQGVGQQGESSYITPRKKSGWLLNGRCFTTVAERREPFTWPRVRVDCHCECNSSNKCERLWHLFSLSRLSFLILPTACPLSNRIIATYRKIIFQFYIVHRQRKKFIVVVIFYSRNDFWLMIHRWRWTVSTLNDDFCAYYEFIFG